MKKLNLQLGSIKEMLTKEQMKKIVGGGGYSCTCTYTWTGPYESHLGCQSGTDSRACADSPANCQAGADAQCATDDCCKDVDCE